jgi:hypothetical protein
MFLLKDIKQRRYAVEPWSGQAGDVVALPSVQASAFLGA